MAKRSNKTVQYLAYVGFRALTFLFHLFPINANLRTARFFGWLWYRTLRRHRELARDHLRRAYGDTMSEEEIDRTALRSCQQMAMMAMELLFTPRLITPWTWSKYILGTLCNSRDETTLFSCAQALRNLGISKDTRLIKPILRIVGYVHAINFDKSLMFLQEAVAPNSIEALKIALEAMRRDDWLYRGIEGLTDEQINLISGCFINNVSFDIKYSPVVKHEEATGEEHYEDIVERWVPDMRVVIDKPAEFIIQIKEQRGKSITGYVAQVPEETPQPKPDVTQKVPNLFEIVESSVNNQRAKFIDTGSRLISSIPVAKADLEEAPSAVGSINKTMTTAEIRQRVERAIFVIEGLEKEKVSPEARASIELLKKNLNQFEADGAVASLIVLARRAQRENQKLIIGLETDWIPGMSIKGSLQRNAIAALMKEIDAIGEALKSMGLDNVEIICGNSNDLAIVLLTEANKTHTNLHNIVVMASVNTINSDTFAALRNVDENDKPFLAGIDPTELIKLYSEFGEATSKQLYIRLTQMLYMTLELAAGKEPSQLPIIASYDKKMRIVIFLPKAEPIDYEVLKNTYAAEKTALSAA